MNEVKTPKKPLIFYYVMVFLLLMMLNFMAIPWMAERQVREVDYGTFMTMTEDKKIAKVEIDESEIVFTDKDGNIYKTGPMNDPDLVQRLHDSGAEFASQIVEQMSPFLSALLGWIVPIAIFMIIGQVMYKRLMDKAGGGGNAMMFGMGKSNAKVYVKSSEGIKFTDVAGEDEAKENLTEIVDYLHNPDKYREIGASMPKGILLVGPPGTGKTMLAKAVAGEANVPFFSMSGSEFVEMFVGMGASKVRDLFRQAKEKAPCIVFIDEIDAIGKKRDGNMGGNDEREQTLNQLLAEMDGFDSSKGIFILAATNRPEVLDKALLRPGRLDRRITVDRPDKKGRIETLKVHSKDVLMDDTVDFDEIAMATSGLVGSDLANIINEAAIAAVKNGRNVVTQKDLLGAFDTVVAGKEKKERVLSKKEKQVVAYHEIGHALIRAIKNNSDPVQKITIIPHTNGSLGYVLNFPEEEKHLETKDELMTDLISLVGGRAAEEVVFGSVTNGAYDDIKKATNLAKTMITRYGMSDRFGLVALSTVEDEYLSGRASMNCAQATEAEVDDEVKKLIASCYEEAKQIIRENREVMDQLARYLYDHETITGKEFMKIFREAKGIPEPVDTSLFSTSEKVAESVTFNEDGSYSSTVSGEPESDIWKNIGSHSDDNESDDTAKEKEDD